MEQSPKLLFPWSGPFIESQEPMGGERLVDRSQWLRREKGVPAETPGSVQKDDTEPVGPAHSWPKFQCDERRRALHGRAVTGTQPPPAQPSPALPPAQDGGVRQRADPHPHEPISFGIDQILNSPDQGQRTGPAGPDGASYLGGPPGAPATRASLPTSFAGLGAPSRTRDLTVST